MKLKSRLRKEKVKMVLSSGQYYCVSLNEEKSYIKLSVVLLPNCEHSSQERIELLQFFQLKLEEVITEFMPASKLPIGYFPCCYCDQLHARVEALLNGKQQHCPVKCLRIITAVLSLMKVLACR